MSTQPPAEPKQNPRPPRTRKTPPCLVMVQFGLEKPGFFEKPGFLVAKLYHYQSLDPLVPVTGSSSYRIALIVRPISNDSTSTKRDVEKAN